MVSVCLPSDALLQHLPSYLGFSYLGREVSLHGCSNKAQLLLLTLEEGYLLTATLPGLQCGIAPLGPPVPGQPPLLGLLLCRPCSRVWVAPPSCCLWPRARGGSSGSPPLALGIRWLLPAAAPDLRCGCLLSIAPDLGRGVALPGRHP